MFKTAVKHRTGLIALASGTLVVLLIGAMSNAFQSKNSPLLPLTGSVTKVGQSGNLDVTTVTFTESATQPLSADNIYLVYTPSNFTAMPLDVALGPNINYFGYEYTTATAATERANRNNPDFHQRFPHKFFASPAARNQDHAHGDGLAAFEQSKGIHFSSTDTSSGSMYLEPSSFYILVMNSDAMISTKPTPVCGDSWKASPEECDNGSLNGTAGNICTLECTETIPLSVRDTGAVGDGVTDDRAAIQTALDTHNIVVIPPGTYLVGDKLNVNSHQRLTLESGATLLAGPTVLTSAMIGVSGVTDVVIEGPGTLDGDKQDAPTAGRHGIAITSGASNILVQGVRAINMPDIAGLPGYWGDGIYVSGTLADLPHDIVVRDNYTAFNERHGISMSLGQRISFINNLVTHNRLCFDVEPSHNDSIITDILISGNTIVDNGCGLGLSSNGTVNTLVSKRMTVTGNTIIAPAASVGIQRNSSMIFSNNNVTLTGTGYYAIKVGDESGAIISNNTVHGGLYGIYIENRLGFDHNIKVTGNTFYNPIRGYFGKDANVPTEEITESGNTVINDQ